MFERVLTGPTRVTSGMDASALRSVVTDNGDSRGNHTSPPNGVPNTSLASSEAATHVLFPLITPYVESPSNPAPSLAQ